MGDLPPPPAQACGRRVEIRLAHNQLAGERLSALAGLLRPELGVGHLDLDLEGANLGGAGLTAVLGGLGGRMALRDPGSPLLGLTLNLVRVESRMEALVILGGELGRCHGGPSRLPMLLQTQPHSTKVVCVCFVSRCMQEQLSHTCRAGCESRGWGEGKSDGHDVR